jgi:SAM-dependent methyltransferase
MQSDSGLGAPARFSPLQALAQLNPYHWAAGLLMRGAAELKIADVLAAGPRTADEVADATGAHRPSMARFLRACAVHGLVESTGDGRWELTDVGQLLRSDIPSLRGFVIAVNGPGMVRPWERLADVVRTGKPSTRDVWGMDYYEYYASHPDEAQAYAESSDVLSIEAADVLARNYDFSAFSRIVDVGGSRGVLLARALRDAPAATGVLLEMPVIVELARHVLAGQGVAKRIDFVAGDFLTEVPSGDLYLLKNVISDLDDGRAMALLGNCLKSGASGSRLLLIDWVVSAELSFVDATDVDFMVLSGGRARTREEYADLLATAGFGNVRPVPLPGFEAAPMAVIEASRP